MRRLLSILALLLVCGMPAAWSRAGEETDENKKKDLLTSSVLSGLRLRSIGPALTSGRVSDLAVHPDKPYIYYVAAASGGVWKTTNGGTTFTPIFDSQPSYSIGAVTLDPNNPLTVWVGSGENKSQRSVSYGDGIYKSLDGGQTWKNMGLKASEHISRIIVDPDDSDHVYVAVEGPLWADGGERGVYETTDGGQSWNNILEISDKTGVTDLVMDPRDPKLLYAASYQRRRHVWTQIGGGPESAVYKTTDGGANWRKIQRGLPSGDKGKIGLAISPADPDTVYAIVEATRGNGGFYRSTNRGESWSKRSSYLSSAPMYYQEIVADPKNVDRVYSLDTNIMVTNDGGATFTRAGESNKHVDNHAMWIDPDNTDHLLVGCDGGVYESFDRAASWHYKTNLPLTQFYKISTDNAEPFYNVYGGTQDNNSLAGPSRTTSSHGITNYDWFVTAGGDGFETQVDPTDHNIIYAQSQYGNLNRFDRRSGERVNIQPQPDIDDPPLRWNWDAPLLISPHSPTRLYFGSQILFRSDDRGQSWRKVSGDLSRDLDRNRLKVMGRVWGIDTVAKNRSTSLYGSLVSLSESPLVEGLIYAGTDDGLIQVTSDGGATWTRYDSFGDVPEMAFVRRLEASVHDPDTVLATFDNHKNGDFKPYILKSADRGASWTSIAGNLPERGSVHAVVQDHESPDLLFAGTEFGLFVTVDGGAKWVRLRQGLPTIAVRDLEIQRRENDLVVGTFGRGIYILDDYSPLRRISEESLAEDFILFPTKKTLQFTTWGRFGGGARASQGASFFQTPNPPAGVTFTYYMKEGHKSLRDQRRERERAAAREGEDVFYPTWDELRAERREEPAQLAFTITDASGDVVTRQLVPMRTGVRRVTWNMRYPSLNPVSAAPSSGGRGGRRGGGGGPSVIPGQYRVQFAKVVEGEVTPLGDPAPLTIESLGLATLAADDRQAVLAFQKDTARLLGAVMGAVQATGQARTRVQTLRRALAAVPTAAPELLQQARRLELEIGDLQETLNGDPIPRSAAEASPPSLVSRIQRLSRAWTVSSAPSQSDRDNYQIVSQRFGEILQRLRQFVETDLPALEARADQAGAPWTPGRLPRWPGE